MLVTCNECGAKISEDAIVCPYCGYRGYIYNAGESSPEVNLLQKMEKAQEEGRKQQEKERGEARERAIREEREKRNRKNEVIGLFIGIIILMSAVVGVAYGIRYIALEIWRFVSTLF